MLRRAGLPRLGRGVLSRDETEGPPGARLTSPPPAPDPRRYISYFSGLLSGSIRMNSSPLFLHYVLVPVLPAFEPGTGECAPRRPAGRPVLQPLR